MYFILHFSLERHEKKSKKVHPFFSISKKKKKNCLFFSIEKSKSVSTFCKVLLGEKQWKDPSCSSQKMRGKSTSKKDMMTVPEADVKNHLPVKIAHSGLPLSFQKTIVKQLNGNPVKTNFMPPTVANKPIKLARHFSGPLTLTPKAPNWT